MSTVLDPVAQSIADTLGAIEGLDTAVAGEKWDPGMAGMDSLPRGVVGLPTIRRTDPAEAESQMGTDDWHMEYPVDLYFDIGEAKYAQAQAAATVEAFISAIDADPSLGDPTIVDDAVVLEAEPVLYLDERRPILAYECRVAVTKLVPAP